jgi:hypothetical protein
MILEVLFYQRKGKDVFIAAIVLVQKIALLRSCNFAKTQEFLGYSLSTSII